MSRRYQGVLLDVDGTLVDSNDVHALAWLEAFAELEVDVDIARVRRLIGLGGDRLIETIDPTAPRGSRRNRKIGERRAERFVERWLREIRPFPGTRELVLRLRAEGYAFAIASAARSEELQPLLELADIADLCEHRATSSDVEESKPSPAAIEGALAKIDHVERHRVVMIGDTPYDLEACRGAGVDMIAFASGGYSQDLLAGAVALYRGPADLYASWERSPLSA